MSEIKPRDQQPRIATKVRFCHWVDIGIEERWANEGDALFPSLKPRFDPKVFDSEQLALHWFNPDDLVVLRTPPNQALIRYWQALDLALPNWYSLDSDSDVEMMDLTTHENLCAELRDNDYKLYPYVTSASAQALADHSGLALASGTYSAVRQTNNKTRQHQLLHCHHIPTPEGEILYTAQDCLNRIETLGSRAMNYVFKSPYGASGKALFKPDSEAKLQFLKHRLQTLIRAKKNIQPQLLERWYSAAANLSYKLSVTESGDIPVEFVKHQLVQDGVYRGFDFSRSGHEHYQKKISKYSKAIAQALYQEGVRGVVNIDAIETSDGELFPAIDINARFSLAMYLEKLACKDEFSRSLYFDLPLPEGVQALLSFSSSLSEKNACKVIVPSISRPDTNGLRRVFVLFSASDLDVLNATQSAWCEHLGLV